MYIKYLLATPSSQNGSRTLWGSWSPGWKRGGRKTWSKLRKNSAVRQIFVATLYLMKQYMARLHQVSKKITASENTAFGVGLTFFTLLRLEKISFKWCGKYWLRLSHNFHRKLSALRAKKGFLFRTVMSDLPAEVFERSGHTSATHRRMLTYKRSVNAQVHSHVSAVRAVFC